MSVKDSLVIIVEGKEISIDELAKTLPDKVVTFGGERPIKVAQPVVDALVEVGKKVVVKEATQPISDPITQGFEGVVPFAGGETQTLPEVPAVEPTVTIPEETMFTPGINLPNIEASANQIETQPFPEPELPEIPNTPLAPFSEPTLTDGAVSSEPTLTDGAVSSEPLTSIEELPAAQDIVLPEVEITPIVPIASIVEPELSTEVVPEVNTSEPIFDLINEQPVATVETDLTSEPIAIDTTFDINAIQSAFDTIQKAVMSLANQNTLLQTQLDNQKKVTETLKVGIEGIKANLPQANSDFTPELVTDDYAPVRQLLNNNFDNNNFDNLHYYKHN